MDLASIQLLTLACRGARLYGEEILRRRAQFDAPLVRTIGKHVVSWVRRAVVGTLLTLMRKYQNLLWPEVNVEAAKKALGIDFIPVGKFNETARIVRDELEKHGPEGFELFYRQ